MPPNFAKEKARELSYALIRASFYVKRPDFRYRIEKLAFELLENSARVSVDTRPENLDETLSTIAVLDSLIRLGHSIYEIEPANATIFIRELDSLNAAILQSCNPAIRQSHSNELPDIEDYFSKVPVVIEDKDKIDKARIQGQIIMEQQEETDILEENESGNPAINAAIRQSAVNESGNESGNPAINAAIRQSLIMGQIKSNNICHFKEIIAGLPDISERTLRYDLQRLCEQGVIERIGISGPGTYYRLSQGHTE